MYPVPKNKWKNGESGQTDTGRTSHEACCDADGSKDTGSASSQAPELGQILQGAGRGPQPCQLHT